MAGSARNRPLLFIKLRMLDCVAQPTLLFEVPVKPGQVQPAPFSLELDNLVF
jgi:hypothetical protein